VHAKVLPLASISWRRIGMPSIKLNNLHNLIALLLASFIPPSFPINIVRNSSSLTLNAARVLAALSSESLE